MTRVCFLLKVRADKLEEYRRRHQQVWPEMLEALRATGWHNYSLFLRPDGLLVGYLETPDFEQARARMQDHPVNARWQAEMAPFFESLEHLRIDAGDCRDAAYFVERIAEVCILSVYVADTGNVARGDMLEKRDTARKRRGVRHSPVTLRISAKYQL